MADVADDFFSELEGTAPTADPTQPSVSPQVPQSAATPDVADSFFSELEGASIGKLASEAIVKPAVQEFTRQAGEFQADPIDFVKGVGAGAVNLAKQLAQSIVDSKFEVAASLGGELAASKIPVVGRAVKPLGSVLGATTGKVFEGGEDFAPAFRQSLLEEVGGRTLARILPFKAGKVDVDTKLADAKISREVAENSFRTVKEAQDDLGVNLPAFMQFSGEFGSKQARELSNAVTQATERAGGDIGNTAFFNDVVKGAQTQITKQFSERAGKTTTPNFKALDTSLKTATTKGIDSRLDGIGKVVEQNNIMGLKSKAVVPIQGLGETGSKLFEDIGTFLEGQGARDVPVTKETPMSILGADGNPIMEITSEAEFDVLKGREIVEPVAKILNEAFTKKGVPRTSLTLREFVEIDAQLSDLTTKFVEGSPKQNVINGIVGSVKERVLNPLEKGIINTAKDNPAVVHPDIVQYIANKDQIGAAYSSLDEVLGTKLAQVGGKTEIAAAKKAASGLKTFKDVTSSGAAYAQTKRVLQEVDPAAVDMLNQRVFADTLAKISGKEGVILSSNINKAIGTAVQPTALREVLTEIDPSLVSTLESARLIQEGVENFAGQIKLSKEDAGKTGADLLKFAVGTTVGQPLIAGTARGSLVTRGVKNMFGKRAEVDRALLNSMTNPNSIDAIKSATATRMLDDSAYDVYRMAVTAFGVRPLSRVEYGEVANAYTEATGNPEASVLEPMFVDDKTLDALFNK